MAVKRFRMYISVVAGLLFVGCVIAILALTARHAFTTDAGDEKYSWQDTKYDDIRTRIVSITTSSSTSILEYPVTPNKAVNEAIAATIDAYHSEFARSHRSFMSLTRQRASENTSYQITRRSGNYLSIVVSTKRDGARSISRQANDFWTFNLQTGKVVVLDDIFGDAAADGKARLALYIQSALGKKIISPLALPIDQIVTTSNLHSFLTTDARTLRFDFAAGEVADEADGSLSVSIPIDNLQLFMQTASANRLFTIQSVDSMPHYTPADATQESVSCANTKCIALTFDDGPSHYTKDVLDSLKKYQAKATFFVIGKHAAKNPALLKRIVSEGHTIGNHSWDHTSLSILGAGAIDSQIIKTNQAVQAATGITPTYVRPPSGAVSRSVLDALSRQRMTGVLWSVDTRDWANRNTQVIANRIIASATKGSIVILHDVNRTSVNAVPIVLSRLGKQGYAFVSLDQMFGPNVAPGQIISKVD